MSSGKAFPKLELFDFVNSIVEIKPYKALIADHEGHIEGKSIALGPHKIAMLLEIFKQWKEHTALIEAKDKEIEQMLMSLFNLADHLETFLNVSQKIHFPEARDDLKIANEIILKKQKEALAGGEDV